MVLLVYVYIFIFVLKLLRSEFLMFVSILVYFKTCIWWFITSAFDSYVTDKHLY